MDTATPAPRSYYATLKDLRDAIDAGEVTDVVLHLDNDEVTATANSEGDAPYIVFETHPAILLEQALDALDLAHAEV